MVWYGMLYQIQVRARKWGVTFWGHTRVYSAYGIHTGNWLLYWTVSLQINLKQHSSTLLGTVLSLSLSSINSLHPCLCIQYLGISIPDLLGSLHCRLWCGGIGNEKASNSVAGSVFRDSSLEKYILYIDNAVHINRPWSAFWDGNGEGE